MTGLVACSPPLQREDRADEVRPPSEEVSVPPGTDVTPPPQAEAPPDSPGAGGSLPPPPQAETPPGTPEPFALHARAPGLLVSPEGYYATSMAVVPDGSFVLTPGDLGPRGGTQVELGRYTARGEPLWRRTLEAKRSADWPTLATNVQGDITLWVGLSGGGDYGSGTVTDISHGLVRFTPEGRFVWVRAADCEQDPLHVDDAGSVTLMQRRGCQMEAYTYFYQRFSPSGDTDFRLWPKEELRLVADGEAVNPAGLTLVAGSDVSGGFQGPPTWMLLGADGKQKASGAVRGITGSLTPLHLSARGQYLALLGVGRGAGSFAGQSLACEPGTGTGCGTYLVSGNVNGREDSVAAFPVGERVLWVSPEGDLITHTLDRAGTGGILRRRSSTAGLLGTYALPSLDAPRGDGPNVDVRRVAPLPEGGLLVLGTLRGAAELDGTRVEAGWSRLFLLRVAL